ARMAGNYLEYFAKRIGKPAVKLSPEVEAAFAAYPWPGNLRELRNVIERAVILSGSETILPDDLPDQFGLKPEGTISVGAPVTLAELEEVHIRRILDSSTSLDDAAKTLGIDPATLY